MQSIAVAALFTLLAIWSTTVQSAAKNDASKLGDSTNRASRVKRQYGTVGGSSLYGTGQYGNGLYGNGLYGTGSGLYGNAYSSGLYENNGYNSAFGDPNLAGTVGVGPGQVGVNGNAGYYTGTNVGFNNYG